jgi:hypothetical protein
MLGIRATTYVVAVFVAFVACGCGERTYPVQGQIVFEDNAPARELAGYTIMFQSEQHQKSASGIVAADGTFTVGTFQDNDGALRGKQRVAITPPIPDTDAPRPPVIIDPAKYSDFAKSQLEVDVKAETNKVTLKVERLRR